MPATRMELPKYIALIDWILRDNVVDRGVESLNEVALATGLIPNRMAWELLRSGLEKIRDDVAHVTQMGLPFYDCELAFACDDDAIMFQMRFA